MVAHKKKMFARVFLLKTLCDDGNVLVTRGTPYGDYITTLILILVAGQNTQNLDLKMAIVVTAWRRSKENYIPAPIKLMR